MLLTDGWWKLPSLARSLPPLRRLAGRFHPDLRSASVISFGLATVWAEARGRMLRTRWYEHQKRMNTHFQARCIGELRKISRSDSPTVFSFSYAARSILAHAREHGWKTVLGQIDPGPMESELVSGEYERLGLSPGVTTNPPAGYWDDWRAECELADRILVNSKWSATCLAGTGISKAKIEVVPCAYQPPAAAASFIREYPNLFTAQRPLRVLFLGQTTIRKGIHLLMDAAKELRSEPVHFTVVGGGLDHPSLTVPPNVTWIGAVVREQTAGFYQQADVFVLPTLSDGFGLVQLEALAWKLPVIATSRCGDAVAHGQNGILLEEVTASCLTRALGELLHSPAELKRMSQKARVSEHFSLSALAEKLLKTTA